MGFCLKPRGGFAARMLLGAQPPDPRWRLPPPDPLLNWVWGGAPAWVWGQSPSYILAAEPPRGSGRNPK